MKNVNYLTDKIQLNIKILLRWMHMAKPIGETPTLYGKEARDFLRKMNEPPSREDREFRKKCESQRIVLF